MQNQNLSESELILAYINGNESALELLINTYKNRIYSFIYNKVLDRDVTEDLFQDTFIKVILTLKKGQYREEGKFLPWVLRIAHNLMIDYFRRNKKSKILATSNEFDVFDFIADESLSAEYQIVKEQILTDVRRLVDELPDDQREVLLMRMYKDMSFKEIADETGVSINTALGRMRYALLNMRKLVEKHNIVLEM
jgi:RNA polymerase sigma-70 factor (ECF subfamily)